MDRKEIAYAFCGEGVKVARQTSGNGAAVLCTLIRDATPCFGVIRWNALGEVRFMRAYDHSELGEAQSRAAYEQEREYI